MASAKLEKVERMTYDTYQYFANGRMWEVRQTTIETNGSMKSQTPWRLHRGTKSTMSGIWSFNWDACGSFSSPEEAAKFLVQHGDF